MSSQDSIKDEINSCIESILNDLMEYEDVYERVPVTMEDTINTVCALRDRWEKYTKEERSYTMG